MEKPAHLVLVSYFDDLFTEEGADSTRDAAHHGRPRRPADDDTVVPFAPLPTESLEPPIEAAVLPLRRPGPPGHRAMSPHTPVHAPAPERPLARAPQPVQPSPPPHQSVEASDPGQSGARPPEPALATPSHAQPEQAQAQVQEHVQTQEPVQAQEHPQAQEPVQAQEQAQPEREPVPAPAPAAQSVHAFTSTTESAPQYLCFELAGFELMLEAGAVAEIRGVPMPARTSSGWRCAELALGRWESMPLLDIQALVGRGPLPVDTGSMVTAVRLAAPSVVLLMPSLPQLETLAATDVTWRGEHGARPWLAGTIRSRRAVVLDVGGLGELLKAH